MSDEERAKTTIDALRLVEEYASGVGERSLAPFNEVAKDALDCARSSGLLAEEQDALYRTLLSIVDSVITERASAKEAARVELSAAKQRAQILIVAALCFFGFLIAAYFQLGDAAKTALLCFVALAVPQLRDWLKSAFSSGE